MIAAVVDPIRARRALLEYRKAYECANRAPIGSPEFRAAMGELQRLAAELGAVGIDPASSWKESTKRKLRVPVPASRLDSMSAKRNGTHEQG